MSKDDVVPQSDGGVLRVLALTPYPVEGPSSRQRIHQYRAPLDYVGVKLDVRPFLNRRGYERRIGGGHKLDPRVGLHVARGFVSRLSLRPAMAQYDVIWVHRQIAPAAHRVMPSLVVPKALPVVFDMDDAVFLNYDIGPLLERATHATVGNAYLAEHVHRSSPDTQVVVVPTTVDMRSAEVHQGNGSPLAVGWIGTPSTYKSYLEPLLGQVVSECKRHGATVRVVTDAACRGSVEAHGAEFRQWRLETSSREVADFDIGLMPLLDDGFSAGKCGFKLIEYGAAAVPSVATDIGANREVIRNGETGLLASSPEEFTTALGRLLENPDLRQHLGVNAKAHVEAHYGLEHHVPVIARVLREAAGQRVPRST